MVFIGIIRVISNELSIAWHLMVFFSYKDNTIFSWRGEHMYLRIA